MDKSTLATTSISLIAGSALLFFTGRYYTNSIANITLIHSNLTPVDDKSLVKDLNDKIIYFKGYPTVLAPANDKNYLIFPPKTAVLIRYVEIYSVRVNRSKKGIRTREYYWRNYSTDKFYADQVKIGNFFLDPRVLERYYKKFKSLNFSKEISNFNNWFDELRIKHKTDYQYNSESEYLYIGNSLLPVIGDKRISYRKLDLSPNTFMTCIGLLKEKYMINEVCLDCKNKFASKLFIDKGDHSANEMIANGVKYVQLVHTCMVISGVVLNTFGFYIFNDSLFEFLSKNNKIKLNSSRFRWISNLSTLCLTGLLYMLIHSSEIEKLSKKIELKSPNFLKNTPFESPEFVYQKNPFNQNEEEEVISNKNI